MRTAVLPLAAVLACAPSKSGLRCGEGTVEESGVCVPVAADSDADSDADADADADADTDSDADADADADTDADADADLIAQRPGRPSLDAHDDHHTLVTGHEADDNEGSHSVIGRPAFRRPPPCQRAGDASRTRFRPARLAS